MHESTRLGLLRATQAMLLLLLCACSSTGVLKNPPEQSATPTREAIYNPSLHDSRVFAQALALFGAGVSAQINGELGLALTNYLNAITLDPTHEELYIRAAVVHLQLNEPDRAIALIQRLCELKPDSAQAFIWYGLMCNAADQRRESYIAFRKAIQLDPLSPDAYKELAANYLRDDEAERAILILERGAQQSSDAGGLLYFLGQLYVHKALACRDPGMASDYRTTARQTLERARNITPDDDEILDQLGDLYIVDRQYEKAAVVLQHLAELQPDNIPLKKELALVYGALSQEDKAVALLEEISRKIAFHPKAYYYLGELYEKMGEKEKAILNFRLATQTDPPDAAPFLHLALLNVETNPEEAIGYLHDGLLKMPDDPRLTEVLAYIYLNQGDFAQAVRYFEKTEQSLNNQGAEPCAPPLLFNYALAAHNIRDYETTARLLHQGIRTDPAVLDAYVEYTLLQEDQVGVSVAQKTLALLAGTEKELRSEILTYLAILFGSQQDYLKASQLFSQVEQEARTEQDEESLTDGFYFWYGSAEERLGNKERAIELLHNCIQRNPENYAAHNYLAYMWAEQGINLREAERLIRIALKGEPENGAYLDTYGWILYMSGRYEAAENQLAAALQLLPDDPEVNEHYGDVLSKLDRPDEARAYWEKALQFNPESTRLQNLVNQPPLLSGETTAP